MLLILSGSGAGAADSWPAVTLAEPRAVELGGPVGAALDKGIARLAQPPYTADWLLADVSFKVNRIFTNYSGDVSGRFLELATLTTPAGRFSPPTLEPVLAEIARYQKADGHFGLEMDFAKPMGKLAPPIPMLWGNARLLVGLVTAARDFHDANLLAAARRLGDFYLNTSDVFCSPAREAELRATGTGGDGYTCCYFPAIEGLALLYRQTHEERYLAQARRMAEWFRKFDALPIDHSHGNLCAWRGILELYQLTGERDYLERAVAKWEAAVRGGFVWPLGGVGEHWYVSFNGDEGCSESDWLRFNLELWRDTGETRFLDMAERLLLNQYLANQCPNGGFGWRPFDGDAAGPIGTRGNVEEWNFCCSFHGPLGLHFLKAYLAAASQRAIFVNFPLDFSATVRQGGREWRAQVRTVRPGSPGQREFDVELAPADGAAAGRATLWLRRPAWAREVKLTGPGGGGVAFKEEGHYLRVEREFKVGESLHVALRTKGLRLERRGFQEVRLEPDRRAELQDVAILDGPELLYATPAPTSGRLTLLLLQSRAGMGWELTSPNLKPGKDASVALPGLNASREQVDLALMEGRPVLLRPEAAVPSKRRTTFAHDVLVVRAAQPDFSSMKIFGLHVVEADLGARGPFFKTNLETWTEAWLAPPGWRFLLTNCLHATGGEIGLLDGEGYADYRFEFDVELPREGQGITGWIVRAADPENCLHFQLQSADSTFNAPEFKTRPNTLRPHVRRNGAWTIADPVPLPKEIRRGESHHVATECRGAQITVFLDGEKIYVGQDAGLRTGSVGFRAAGAAEQGRFWNIALVSLTPNH